MTAGGREEKSKRRGENVMGNSSSSVAACLDECISLCMLTMLWSVLVCVQKISENMSRVTHTNNICSHNWPGLAGDFFHSCYLGLSRLLIFAANTLLVLCRLRTFLSGFHVSWNVHWHLALPGIADISVLLSPSLSQECPSVAQNAHRYNHHQL